MTTDIEQQPGHDTRFRHRQAGRLLRKCHQVPRDTLITEDIPLLLTRLARVPY